MSSDNNEEEIKDKEKIIQLEELEEENNDNSKENEESFSQSKEKKNEFLDSDDNDENEEEEEEDEEKNLSEEEEMILKNEIENVDFKSLLKAKAKLSYENSKKGKDMKNEKKPNKHLMKANLEKINK